ncbi:hypothetical protein MKK68_25015 [Methylobacterium sp. E-016]|jgi:hypothetical protein|uniref:hypothetical protein n=1 Tax=Methylobacterium sp. E-016 TaxID=2836556 RepID=UPI001FBB12F9|nr:hypothetical protein [Methylobacterium sp. E-016]MCJ2078859.1 hypothetical protein [Methylobacterium sp. E-016]
MQVGPRQVDHHPKAFRIPVVRDGPAELFADGALDELRSESCVKREQLAIKVAEAASRQGDAS